MKEILKRTPLLYLITDREQLTPSKGASEIGLLLDFIDQARRAGVDLIQIREKDMPARSLYSLVESAHALLSNTNCRLLVNDRADIAAAFPGVGVHLTSTSMTAAVVRQAFGDDLLIGVSTHSAEEVRAAERGSADFVVFGPVFETASKKQYGEPQGLGVLKEAIVSSNIPVLGLGGIGVGNYQRVIGCGAAGVAGISLFSAADDLHALVRKLKSRC